MPEEGSTANLWYLVLVLLIYYLFNRNKGQYLIDKALLNSITVLALYFIGEGVIWMFRYKMPHVVCNGFSGSILGRPDKVGDWAIFRTGESIEPVHIPGKLATLVVPWDSLQRAGKNFCSLTLVRKTPVKYLPPVVYRYLQRNKDGIYDGFNIEKIYFGIHTEKWIAEHVEQEVKDDMVEDLNQRVNFRGDLMIGRRDDITEEIEATRDWHKGKTSFWDFFRKKKQEEGDQE